MPKLGDLISGICITGAGAYITFAYPDSIFWTACGIIIIIIGVCGLVMELEKD